jgi:ketosteroid isomerase-like protein
MPGSVNVSLRPAYRRLQAAWVVCVALALVESAIPFSAAMPLAQKHESHHEIDQLEDQWRDAVLTSNTKALDSLLAEDYMAITPSGTLQSRDETLENLRTGRVHFTLLDVSDRKVRFYGTTAVVTSLANIQATTPDGKVSGSYRYTRVYVRDAQGDWKIVSFEASRVREPGPHKRSELQ